MDFEAGKISRKAMIFERNVGIKTLSQMYEEQARLLVKIQTLLDLLEAYTEEVRKEFPGDEIPDTNNPYRVKWEYSGGLLKITIPGHLPKLNYYSKDWIIVRNDVVKRLFNGLKDLPEGIKFRRACCVFKMFCTAKHNWDVQNRAYQAVLNVMAMKNIIPDDNYKHVVTVLAGEQVKTPEEERIEIYLFEKKDFRKYENLFQQL